MKEQKKGISLIVLVITIIVMLILASAVIISLSNSNIITKAKEAVLKTDVKNFAQELSVSLAEQKLNNKYLEIDNVTETDLAEIKKYIPNFDEKYAGKIFIQNGELVYDASKVTENEKVALESVGVKSGTTYTPAEIKAIIEEKNLGADVSTTDITTYVDGLSKKEAEKYTIFRGDLYYRYEKTTYEEQLELYNAGISILMGDGNEDGTLDETDVLIPEYYEGGQDEIEYKKNLMYAGNVQQDNMVSSSDGTIISCVINGTYKITDVVSLEDQHPDKIRFLGDYLLFNDHMCFMYPDISIPRDLNTTEYGVMKQYFPDMTEEQANKFAIVEGAIVYRTDKLTDEEKIWADAADIPYV